MRSRRRHEAAQRHEHPSDWLAGARAGIRREVADTVAALVAEHPDWDAQRLADAVDAPPAPDTRPKVPPARCGECSGTGRVFVADDVADVCPACRGTGFGDGPTLRAVPA